MCFYIWEKQNGSRILCVRVCVCVRESVCVWRRICCMFYSDCCWDMFLCGDAGDGGVRKLWVMCRKVCVKRIRRGKVCVLKVMKVIMMMMMMNLYL